MVLDVHTGRYRAADVVCRNGRILEIGEAAPRFTSTVLDVRGGFVLPGLVDAHVHATAVSADLGVTETMPPSLATARAARARRRPDRQPSGQGGAQH